MKRTSSTILLLLCLTASFMAFGQRTKMLSGQVDCPEPDCAGINVLNKRSLQGTITDEWGRFSIPVRLGDTLVFSAVQFKVKQLKVEEYLLKTSFVRVPMEPFVNELDEVVVQPYNLSGSLGTDATQILNPQHHPVLRAWVCPMLEYALSVKKNASYTRPLQAVGWFL